MKNILVTETFYSLQSEGLHVGVPSVFVRSYGCNFRCDGFGRDHAPDNAMTVDKIDFKKYTKLEDIPLVDVGCDSFTAWAPGAKHLQTKYTTETLLEEIKRLAAPHNFYDVDLVLTGGEPLLPGWQKFYSEFFKLVTPELIAARKYWRVTFETNTTHKLLDTFKDALKEAKRISLTFACSPKLSNSGETKENRFMPEVYNDYEEYADDIFLKFVVDNENVMPEINNYLEAVKTHDYTPQAYLMPVGGTNETYAMNQTAVAELAMKYNYKFSPRLQCTLFENKWGT